MEVSSLDELWWRHNGHDSGMGAIEGVGEILVAIIIHAPASQDVIILTSMW